MVAASFILPRASGAPQAAEEPAKSPALSDGISIFNDVWQTVRDRFYDPHFNGLDWSAVSERYRAVAAQATSDERLAVVINDMLSELHASHTRYYSSDEPEYYQLAGIFAGALRRRGLDRAFPGGRISYPGIGILSRTNASGGSMITGVIEGTPAEKADLLAGDEIVGADGAPFEPVRSFRDKVGKQVVLTLRRGGTVLQASVTPVDIEPNRMFLDGMRASARLLQANFRRIGYVHVWSYAGYAYQEALERLLKTNDFPDAAKVWEAEVEDGFTTGPEQQQKVRGLSEVNYQLKNYDKAIEYGQRALKGGYGDEHIKTIVGQAYYLKGDWKGTLHFEEDLVNSTIKAGGTPAVEPLQLILSSCVKLEDRACQTKALERMVTFYPKPEYWSNLLLSLLKETASSDSNTLEVYRLMLEVDVLNGADDYTEMAQLAMDAGTPGEAQRVLQRGFDKNVFTEKRGKEKNQRLLEKAKQAAAQDQATLEKTTREAEAATTGGKNAGMGLAYLNYGQYDKAVDQFTKAISKGGLRNAPETQLLLGIAQLKAGHKDDAVKAFKAVKGDPVLERLQSLWVLHARQA